jgi:hypothetical protein
MNIIILIGFTVFFILGFLCGQSRWWYAIRKVWRDAMSKEEED